MTDLVNQTFDLVHYGGYSYESVLRMPPFERVYLHDKVCSATEGDVNFQLALHDKKRGR